MGIAKTRNEIQFVKLLEKTRALDNSSWRKPHFFEHLKKLHAELKETPGLTADDRVIYEKSMAQLGQTMLSVAQPETSSRIAELIHRRRNIVEEEQRLKAPKKAASLGEHGGGVATIQEEYVPERDVSEVLQQHKERQAKLADQMLAMTRNLKNVSVAARDIISQDNRNLSDVQDVVDKNTAKLNKETGQLEKFNKASGKCWVWSLIFLVMAIFIVMVIFIRLFPKRRPPQLPQ